MAMNNKPRTSARANFDSKVKSEQQRLISRGMPASRLVLVLQVFIVVLRLPPVVDIYRLRLGGVFIL